MPVNVRTRTTAPTVPQVSGDTEMRGWQSAVAYQPDFNRDIEVGGATIDETSVPLVDGLRLAYPGDIFKKVAGNDKWVLVEEDDDGTGLKYGMLLHTRDCTTGPQSFNPLLRSDHVLSHIMLPAALIQARLFQHHTSGNVRGQE